MINIFQFIDISSNSKFKINHVNDKNIFFNETNYVIKCILLSLYIQKFKGLGYD